MKEARNLENSFENSSSSTKGGLYYAARLSYAKFLPCENNAGRGFKVIKVIACTHPVYSWIVRSAKSCTFQKFAIVRNRVSRPSLPPPPEIERIGKISNPCHV